MKIYSGFRSAREWGGGTHLRHYQVSRSLNTLFDNMRHVQNTFEGKQTRKRRKNSEFHSGEKLLDCQAVAVCGRGPPGLHKLTSRTSVGVLDWSCCCSCDLLPAFAPPDRLSCCRLAARTRSICSWHARKHSWKHTHTHARTMGQCQNFSSLCVCVYVCLFSLYCRLVAK